MSKCPYTWVRSLFKREKKHGSEASELRVKVIKKGECTLDVSLPARSANWLMDLIPEDVMLKIRNENIPIDEMQKEISSREKLYPSQIFDLVEDARRVQIWLE